MPRVHTPNPTGAPADLVPSFSSLSSGERASLARTTFAVASLMEALASHEPGRAVLDVDDAIVAMRTQAETRHIAELISACVRSVDARPAGRSDR